MDEKIFQEIFDQLEETLPEDWEKLAFYAEYAQGSYSMKYYVKRAGLDYRDCYGLEKSEQRYHRFMKIDRIISPVRNALAEEKRWNVFTLLVEKDGTFLAEYDYDDVSDNSIEYARRWKEKYLL